MIHEINIKAVLNGYVAKVGCQTMVFDDRKKMLAELDRYYSDPDATEKEYREKGLNAKHTFGQATFTTPGTISGSIGGLLVGSTAASNLATVGNTSH